MTLGDFRLTQGVEGVSHSVASFKIDGARKYLGLSRVVRGIVLHCPGLWNDSRDVFVFLTGGLEGH